MPNTFGDIKDPMQCQLSTDLGILPTDKRFAYYVNKARETLLNEGRWWGTYKRANICLGGKCWIQPGEIASLEVLEFVGRNIPIKNGWWEFREDVRPPTFSNCDCSRDFLLDRGTSPVGVQPSVPSFVRLYAANAADVGKKILWQGIDQNGVVVRNTDGSGNWFDGEYITLVAPPGFATSVAEFTTTTGVQKPVTADRVTANYVNPSTLAESLAATYQWNDTAPAFRAFTLTKFPGPNAVNCQSKDVCPPPKTCESGFYTATFIAKLAYYPCRVDTDWLVLNMYAVADYAVSLFKEDRGRVEESMQFKAKAISRLRSELRTMTGDRTTVWVDVQGSAQLSKVTGGFI